ncbi:MAG: ATP-binding cassette domain-containing protein [Myxococcota bacterium]|jgi:ABC-2 type transport system ATP-binding protein|nr:ATP-binding cassette domain-containing protein [Myxococcota bacterium]
MPTIQVERLHKSYGSHVALRGISFEVERGEIVGFLGPNGAGKSTAMRIITGFLAPSDGSARIEGHDVLEQPIQARRHLGYLPESAPVYPDMRVGEYLDYVGQIREMGSAERAAAIARVSKQCGISERLNQQVHELSKGYRQRLGLAQAMLHSPRILVLDEPTTGLDPNQIVEIRNLIREIGRNQTVLLSTHILSEVQATCDRVLIIHAGQIVADGSTDEITARTRGGQLIQVTYAPGKIAPNPDTVHSALEALEHVDRITVLEGEEPEHMAFEVLASGDVRASLFQLAVDEGLVLLKLAREQSNLEEVFRRLTQA